MATLFVPFSGEEPAALDINGHRLLILSKSGEVFDESLNLFGADSVRELELGDTEEAQANLLQSISQVTHAGVVIAPSEISVEDLIRSLEGQLPWIQ
jgi:hypothetical protein